MSGRIPTEAAEQVALFRWKRLAACKHPELELLFAVPNGGSRHPAEAAHLKAQGVCAGVPDIWLPVPRGGFHGLVIELKRLRGGRVSKEQKSWLFSLERLGYRAEVCEGWVKAKECIEEYLEDT